MTLPPFPYRFLMLIDGLPLIRFVDAHKVGPVNANHPCSKQLSFRAHKVELAFCTTFHKVNVQSLNTTHLLLHLFATNNPYCPDRSKAGQSTKCSLTLTNPHTEQEH